jgi:hypothetical protein
MTQQPRPLVLRLGTTAEGDPVPLELAGRGIGLWVIGERFPVFAVARALMLQLAAQTPAPPLLRADERITIDEHPVVALVAAGADLPPPTGDVPRLTIDAVPWALLHADASVRLRCALTSRAEFPRLFQAARMRGGGVRGRHARADENGGIFATSTLIS